MADLILALLVQDIIIPLSDARRELVVSLSPEGRALLGRHAEQILREKLQEAGEDPARVMFEGPKPLAELALIDIRPITFIPADELKPLAERLLARNGSEAAYLEAWPLGGRAKHLVGHLLPVIRETRTFHDVWHAARILIRIGPHAAEAVPALVLKLEKAEGGERSYWAEVLAGIGDPAVPELGRLLEGGDHDLRGRAARALAQAGAEGPRVLRQALSHESLEIRLAAARGMRHSKAVENIEALIPRLKDVAQEIRDEAAYALGVHGPAARAAVPELMALLPGPSRGPAAWALGEIRPEPDTVVPALVAQLPSDPKREGLSHAAVLDALSKYGPAAAPAVAALPALLGGEDARVQAAALRVAAAVGRSAAPCLPAIRDLLERLPAKDFHGEDDVLPLAFRALAAMGPAAAPAVDAILAAMEKGAAAEACYALGAIGPAAKRGLPAMVPRLFSYGSVDMPPFWTPRLMAAIDPDEAIRAIRADLGRKPRVRELRTHDWREWTIEELGRLKDVAAGKPVRLWTGIEPPKPDYARLLRPGDAAVRVIAFFGSPSSATEGVLLYAFPESAEEVEITLVEGRIKQISIRRR